DAADFVVYELSGGFPVWALLDQAPIAIALVQRPDLWAHAPAHHHLMSDRGHLLQIVLRPCCHDAIHKPFGGPSAERTDHSSAQIVLAIVESVIDWALQSHAERLPARNDGDLLHRVRARNQETKQRMPRFVIGDPLPIQLAEHDLPLAA